MPNAAVERIDDSEAPETLRSEAVEHLLLKRLKACIHDFPGYAQVYRLVPLLEPWTVENGLMTPTLKIKRPKIKEQFAGEIGRLYEGHIVSRAEAARV